MAILSKVSKSDNFQPYNFIKLSFTDIQEFQSNFVDYESFLESKSPDILVLYETILKCIIDSSHFLWGVIFF